MHSIVILGDTRTHLVMLSPADWTGSNLSGGGRPRQVQKTIRGGVYLMRLAIQQMSQECSVVRPASEGPNAKRLDEIIERMARELRSVIDKGSSSQETQETIVEFDRGLIELSNKWTSSGEIQEDEETKLLSEYLLEKSKRLIETPSAFDDHSGKKVLNSNTAKKLVNLVEDEVQSEWNKSLQAINRRIFSFAADYKSTPQSEGKDEYVHWNLVPKELRTYKTPKARLDRREESGASPKGLPEISSRLIGALQNPTISKVAFDDISESSQPGAAHLKTCPDIVVLDDLDISFRTVKFPISEESGKQAETRLDNLSSPKDRSSKQTHKDVATTLYRRFLTARQKHVNIASLEPAIFGSIRGNPCRVFDNLSSPKAANERNLWSHLADDPWLRKRTVILLDVEDLRQDGLAISTGLSWERTAQDTISQIRHSGDYRNYLLYGHLIIRYGVTGALHIANDPDTQRRTHTLYFDPKNDDAAWDRSSQDGHMLGATSVYAAHFVKAIQQQCRRNGGAPLLDQLAPAMHTCIVGAIKSSQLLHRTSYGEGTWEYAIESWNYSELLPRGVFCGCHNSNTSKEPPSDRYRDKILRVVAEPERKDIQVVSASIPGLLQRNWSILTQSALIGNMEPTASEIVRVGPDEVFNFDLPNDFFASREALAHCLQDAIYESDETDISEIVSSEDEWLKVCSEAVRKFSNDYKVPKHKNQARQLQDPSDEGLASFDESLRLAPEDEKEGLREDRAALKDAWETLRRIINNTKPKDKKALWQSFLQPEADEVFRVVLGPRRRGSRDDRYHGFSANALDPIVAPLVQYDFLSVVDRREVEGFRAIEKLMKDYLKQVKDNKNNRPLCIAIFGPPGAGKSSAVKAINKSIKTNQTEVVDPFNLGEYTDVKDLDEAFDKISKICAAKKVPIAFFDEFDSRYGGGGKEGGELGWLKFFLAPMEDGLFREKLVKNAILVFAGGTSPTFSDFSLANRSDSDEQFIRFSRAKGPDFASRLSAHLDIVGINTTGPEDELYMIRRALAIRSLLSKSQDLQPGDLAKVDYDTMLPALLKVPQYRNGIRSLRTMLELFTDQLGSVSPSEIPPIHQLNMHVDGKAFLDLIHATKPN